MKREAGGVDEVFWEGVCRMGFCIGRQEQEKRWSAVVRLATMASWIIAYSLEVRIGCRIVGAGSCDGASEN